jgi:hypothetical protein
MIGVEAISQTSGQQTRGFSPNDTQNEYLEIIESLRFGAPKSRCRRAGTTKRNWHR